LKLIIYHFGKKSSFSVLTVAYTTVSSLADQHHRDYKNVSAILVLHERRKEHLYSFQNWENLNWFNGKETSDATNVQDIKQ